MNWSDHLMRWRQVVFPLCAVILSFFIALKPMLWAVGWFISLLILLYWRRIERHIDEQIVSSYPRIIQLERNLGMTFYSHYIYTNRNARLPDSQDMPEFLNDGTFNYQGVLDLIESAHELRRPFVNPRGHEFHFWLVAGYAILGSLALIVWAIFLLQ